MSLGNDHIDAAIGLIRDQIEVVNTQRSLASVTPVVVYDGKADNLAATPYVVVYPPPPLRHRGERVGAARLDGQSVHVDMELQVLTVGSSRQQAGWAADVVADALLDVTPSVAGRRCWPIRQTYARPASLDVDDPDLYVTQSGWRLRSVPT